MQIPSKTTVHSNGLDTRRRTSTLLEQSALSNGAVVERLARMRAACQALAFELAGVKRELRATKAELRRLKHRFDVH